MGFKTGHEARDAELPKVRQRMKDAIDRDFAGDENVISLFYGGSIGTGNTDLYSDIDVRIVVKEEVFEEYRLQKKLRAQNWGTVLFYEDFPWASHSVAHYDDFIKVDSFYYTKKDIGPSLWLKEIEIAYDRNHLMRSVQKESREILYEPSYDEFDLWRNKFFAYSHELYRGVNRGELFYARSSLDTLRFFLTTGWFMEAGLQPNNPGWAKIGGKRSRLQKWQEQFLEKTMGDSEADSILYSTSMIIQEFKRIHSELCKKLGQEENGEQVSKIFGMIL